MKVILASASPYKAYLLKRICSDFLSVDAQINEEEVKQDTNLPPKEKALKLSYLKAKAVQEKYPQDLIIGADQILFLENSILGKSYEYHQAIKQIELLSGKTHTLYTAYTILTPKKKSQHCDQTALTMRELSKQEIKDYVTQEKSYDTAGSYKIEGSGISLFEKIDSQDFTAIMGLPLIQLKKDISF